MSHGILEYEFIWYHILEKGGMPMRSYINTVQWFPRPTSVKELQLLLGDITVSNLDHETHDQYILVIQAEEDQSPKSSVLTSLTINIQDSNEYPPVFTQSNYEATISEASVVNSTVLLVLAEDSDPSHTVSYKPDGSADSMIFFLDSATGLITLLGSVDRDTDNMYTFEVIAVDDDPTPKSATATVTIYISDENDNSPTFTDAKQETHADEQILIIPHVIYDVAMNNMIMDDDEGVNSELKYSFQTGDSAFSIDPDTGFISVVAVLDFNTQSVYKLTIIATDQAVLASERRTGSFVLTVIVDDINDNSPVLASIGPQTIEENLPAGSIVFTVSATDLDQGLPTPLSLSIMDQTVPFSINTVGTPTNTFISAQISTNRMFDFENISEKSFSLTIQVSDGINTQYEIVIVTTEDTNDNSPVFSSSTGYTFSVNETETGKIIGFVAASDVDTSIFGPVTYVKTGDNEDYFQLDSTTGEISIQIALDAESLSVYRFSIVAFDSGLPPLSEIALVSINVLDFNDNSPIFLISHVEVSIDENTATPIIFTFVAKDMDRDAPNNIVKYFIVDSFPVISVLSDFFVIDEMTGIIQTGEFLFYIASFS
ncbi:Protocadherin-16-like [Oopsacas minuta]|uniref:Protocadherin-16-like n=1 Tax=Oopsacas minuta TaxID=111878 RepID=A0AAV7K927_9METZ|nr:Protocadherin-16-like [Oopsacas minuta]